ncbi:hypothetical protein HMPREF3104_03615 [Corynebacterium sp. HMSC30G07]|uniref:hypothetical protein n=1 Tax=Corynebacterium sp. HMSC30G07 TaxID=1581072 RepID=UPI0008A19596|nr:hypothetical protein [Corynebacterium sp. HMSC30G07]OFT77005.1 hypothetical protein HMPREF3104_03615 [Corynebacterium sp. HMSC30G07]
MTGNTRLEVMGKRSRVTVRTDPDRVVVRGPNRVDLSPDQAFAFADAIVDHAERITHYPEDAPDGTNGAVHSYPTNQ